MKKCKRCKKDYLPKDTAKKRIENSKYCSIICRNLANAKRNYKNGYWVDKDGYRIKDINGKHYRVHRLIMEKHLKRKLKRSEVVHHINHNKQDNRISNLIVVKNAREHARLYHNKTKHIGCYIKNCGNKHVAKGLCKKHYYQKRYEEAFKNGNYKKFL